MVTAYSIALYVYKLYIHGMWRTSPSAIRKLRTDRGLTAANAADGIGINRHTLRSFETEERDDFRYGDVARIARYYGVPLDHIVRNITSGETPRTAPPASLPASPELDAFLTRIEELANARGPRTQDGQRLANLYKDLRLLGPELEQLFMAIVRRVLTPPAVDAATDPDV